MTWTLDFTSRRPGETIGYLTATHTDGIDVTESVNLGDAGSADAFQQLCRDALAKRQDPEPDKADALVRELESALNAEK